MPRRTLNLGILAHVDAGKTTLTERLLYTAGVIDTVGSVDAGTTQTDTLALERQRGITIKAAVVSFDIDGVRVNLIDTPGHPDFIAEVERVLTLLDGAVLVISAVEGVQPQTRVLMRALRRLKVPTLIFINKIDRRGADPRGVMEAIRRRLGVEVVPDGIDRTTLIQILADHDDGLLAAYVENEATITDRRLRKALVRQTRGNLVHPVYCGSAMTGDGVEALRAGLVELLPTTSGDPAADPYGRIFKIDRGPSGERIAYVRMFAGRIQVRQRLPIASASGGGSQAKATVMAVADQGTWLRRGELEAGEIGRLWGLHDVRIGDTIGQAAGDHASHRFAPPTMESVVVPVRSSDDVALRTALAQLAEQDPLINVRSDDTGREISVSLYGEVQKEVIQATLATDFGIDVTFCETTTICVERPLHRGEAIDYLNTDANPFRATIGLRVEPAPPGSGVEFHLAVEPQAIPLYVYKSADTFTEYMGQYVRGVLREGRFGWQVTDCVVTMVASGYSVADGPPSRRGPDSTAADFRNLTPLVLMAALEEAGTVVCEPMMRINLEAPLRSTSAVLTGMSRLGATVRQQAVRGDQTVIEAVLPASRVRELQRQLPGLTSGEGVFESAFDGYEPVRGEPSARARTSADPRNREVYLRSLTRFGGRG